MRILHVVHQHPPEHVGGTELYCQSLAQRQQSDGNAVAVFAPTSIPEISNKQVSELGTIMYRPSIGKRSATKVFRATFGNVHLDQAFAETLEDFRPEIVHIQHLQGLPSSIIDRLFEFNLPFVVTVHDYWYICANAQLVTNYDQTICDGPRHFLNCGRCALARVGSPATNILSPAAAPLMAWRNNLLRPILNRADRVIAPTMFVKQLYQSFDVPAEKIVVIPHGIDVPELEKKRPKQSAEKFVVTYIGGLSWQKGIHVLIEAFNQLPQQDLRLNIFGNLDAFPDYVASLKKIARHPGINFSGLINREQVWSALASTDVVVVPSLWYETASLIIQESFAAGVPVVASKIGALQERIQDGVDGLLVDPGDSSILSAKLAGLHENPQLLAGLQAGILPVRNIAQHAADIERIYKQVLQNGELL